MLSFLHKTNLREAFFSNEGELQILGGYTHQIQNKLEIYAGKLC